MSKTMNPDDLKAAATNKKIAESATTENIDRANSTSNSSDDEPAIVFGQVPKSAMVGTAVKETDDLETPKSTELTDDDLRTVMPDLSDSEFLKSAKDIKRNFSTYRKNLILQGFTPEEADLAARNKMKKDSTEINDNYLTEHPKVGIVEVDKKDAEKLEFTPEEKDKLTRSKAIKLVVVENEDLKHIKIKQSDPKQKVNFLKTVEGSVSKYSVPLPILGDYVTFKGAQIVQLISTAKYDDDRIEDMIGKKASLIYDRLIGGTIFNKYDNMGKTEMSYNDFANEFKYHDINMAIYAILVASSMEESETNLTCPSCSTAFQWKYNIKGLLKLDDVSDQYKEMIDTILAKKNDTDTLNHIHEENYEVHRYQSPFTKNIYDVSYPSIARAINLFSAIDTKDTTMAYLSAVGIFLQNIYIYDKESDEYIQIQDSDIQTLMETLQVLPQNDITMLLNQLQGMLYDPKFVLESKCPNCGERMINRLNIDDLIFLSAQDIGTEIR